jgi:y4mF family transcriptional regulator
MRGRRTDLGLSQVELARLAGVSRKWISEFEGGHLSAEIGLVLRVLEALGLAFEVVSSD